MKVSRTVADRLGFDLKQAVADFAAAKEEHRFTVNVPAPTAHPLVEDIYRNGGEFELVEETPDGKTVGPKWSETVERRLVEMQADVAELKAALASPKVPESPSTE